MHTDIKIFRKAALKWWVSLTPDRHREILNKYFPWTEYSTWLQLGEIGVVCLFYEHERFDADKRPIKVQVFSSDYKRRIIIWWRALPKEERAAFKRKYNIQNHFWWSDAAYIYEREHGVIDSIMTVPLKIEAPASDQPTKHNAKPCDLPCPKCGSADIAREFIMANNRYSRAKFPSSATPCLKPVENSVTLVDTTQDFILHVCKCCQYKFTSLPLTQ